MEDTRDSSLISPEHQHGPVRSLRLHNLVTACKSARKQKHNSSFVAVVNLSVFRHSDHNFTSFMTQFLVLVPPQMHHQSVIGTWCVREIDEKTNKEREWYPAWGADKCKISLHNLSDSRIKEKEVGISYT